LQPKQARRPGAACGVIAAGVAKSGAPGWRKCNLRFIAQGEAAQGTQSDDERSGFEPFAHEDDRPDGNPNSKNGGGKQDYFSASSFHKLGGSIKKEDLDFKRDVGKIIVYSNPLTDGC